jgi:uncharacterized membrane protein YagU involved in acid resistance
MRKALLVGLVVGLIDISDAILFWAIYRGTPPMRIFHSVAAGLSGRERALAGGLPTAILGGVLHFFIATVVVLVYYAASSKLTALVTHPVILGMLYGFGVYLVMYFITMPLTGGKAPSWAVTPILINNIGIHMLGIGLPTGLGVRWARMRSASIE